MFAILTFAMKRKARVFLCGGPGFDVRFCLFFGGVGGERIVDSGWLSTGVVRVLGNVDDDSGGGRALSHEVNLKSGRLKT